MTDEDEVLCPRCGDPMNELAAEILEMCETCFFLDEDEKKFEEAENEEARSNEERHDGKRDGGQE